MQSPQSAEELQPYSEIVALPTLKLHKRGGRMCVCVCVCVWSPQSADQGLQQYSETVAFPALTVEQKTNKHFHEALESRRWPLSSGTLVSFPIWLCCGKLNIEGMEYFCGANIDSTTIFSLYHFIDLTLQKPLNVAQCYSMLHNTVACCTMGIGVSLLTYTFITRNDDKMHYPLSRSNFYHLAATTCTSLWT